MNVKSCLILFRECDRFDFEGRGLAEAVPMPIGDVDSRITSKDPKGLGMEWPNG